MSNITPEDVDSRLTTIYNKLDEEDLRLWEGLENEKVSRIAGDEANKQFALQVQAENQGTERRLSEEVIQREEGDLRNIGSLTELAQALSDYRIKTDIELNNERIARQQLGVDLNTRVDNFVATWDHEKFLIYQAIQTVQDDVSLKYLSMDQRIRKYEDMLQDITMDSIQITMDNGEINMGAWTILSQAREWDLEIIGMFKDYKHNTDQSIDDAIKDIESKIPISEEIIRDALDALGDSPIIKDLQTELGGLEVTIDGVTQTMMEHRTEWQNEMIDLSKVLGDQVKAESDARALAITTEAQARTDEIRKETATRTEQIRELDDGLTVEIQERIDGDNVAYEMIENLKASSEGNLADVYQKIAVNTNNISANATKIEQVTAEVVVAKDDAGKALVNSATALEQANSAVTATTALAERVTTTEASLEGKVDTVVFNQTKAEVDRIDGVTKANTQSITNLRTDLNTQGGVISGHTQAINGLYANQTAMGDSITALTNRTTVLESSVGDLRTDMDANASATENLKTQVEMNGTQIKAISEESTVLKVRLDGLRSGGDNLLKKSNMEILWKPSAPTYPHGKYELSEPWVEGETYTITYCVTVKTTDGSSLGIYAGGGLQRIDKIASSETREVITKQFVKDSTNLSANVINFYLLDYTSASDSIATIHWAVMTRGEGVGVSSWKPSNQDTTDAIADMANSEVIADLRAEVQVLDGKVTATANDLVILNSEVDANHAEMINNYYTKVDTDNVISANVTSLKAEMKNGERNFVRNTGFKRRGSLWMFQDLITAKLTGTVTVSFDLVEHSGAPVGGGVGFNKGDGGTSGHEYFWYPTIGTGHHTWTGNVDSKDFTHFGIYTNTECTISNVKVERGSIETPWLRAPEDIDTGGRNLIKNSEFKKGMENWSIYNSQVAQPEATIEGKIVKYAYMYNVPAGEFGGIYITKANIPYTAQRGDVMTVSFYARGIGRLLIGFEEVSDFVLIDTTWRRYTLTLSRKSNEDCYFYLEGAVGNYVDIALPKVELGNAASQWTPAPEDIEQDLRGLATATSTLTAQVTEIDGRVSTSASQILTLESFKSGIVNGEIPGNKNVEIDLRDASYGQDTYFPVLLSTISITTRTYLRVMATLDYASKPNWAIHAGGFSCTYDWEQTGSGWGTIDPEQIINNAVWGHTANNQSPVLRLSQATESSQPVFWVRGGGRYYLSLPESRTIQICPPNGNLTTPPGVVLSPMLYDPFWVPMSLNQNNKVQGVKLQQTNEVVDGVKAVSTVSVNNNGFMSGYGLISQLINGVVVSAFGVDADYFYVGKSMANAKKPFMVLTTPQTIGGVLYPAGVWMDVAVIASATIGTAHIKDASITNAKIVDLNADKITAGTINADRIGANTITAEKLTIGDTTNLWGNQYFDTKGAKFGGSSQFNGGILEIYGMGVQCWGRDHIAPYSTRIPMKAGDTIVIEFSGGHNAGPAKEVGVGIWFYNKDGNTVDLHYPRISTGVLNALGGGWYRYRLNVVVPADASIMHGVPFVQIEQTENESNPMRWTIGNLSVRKASGGELIVNGAITADKIKVNELSAISANLGTFTSTSADGSKMVITGAKQEMFYPNGNIAGRIGVW